MLSASFPDHREATGSSGAQTLGKWKCKQTRTSCSNTCMCVYKDIPSPSIGTTNTQRGAWENTDPPSWSYMSHIYSISLPTLFLCLHSPNTFTSFILASNASGKSFYLLFVINTARILSLEYFSSMEMCPVNTGTLWFCFIQTFFKEKVQILTWYLSAGAWVGGKG